MLAVLQYPDTLVVAPVVKNPLDGDRTAIIIYEGKQYYIMIDRIMSSRAGSGDGSNRIGRTRTLSNTASAAGML